MKRFDKASLSPRRSHLKMVSIWLLFLLAIDVSFVHGQGSGFFNYVSVSPKTCPIYACGMNGYNVAWDQTGTTYTS